MPLHARPDSNIPVWGWGWGTTGSAFFSNREGVQQTFTVATGEQRQSLSRSFGLWLAASLPGPLRPHHCWLLLSCFAGRKGRRCPMVLEVLGFHVPLLAAVEQLSNGSPGALVETAPFLGSWASCTLLPTNQLTGSSSPKTFGAQCALSPQRSRDKRQEGM